MSNVATYLNTHDHKKLERIAEVTGVSKSRVIQLAIHNLDEQYFIDLVQGYKNSS